MLLRCVERKFFSSLLKVLFQGLRRKLDSEGILNEN